MSLARSRSSSRPRATADKTSNDFSRQRQHLGGAGLRQYLRCRGGVLAGVLADNGGPVQTIALNASATNPTLDASGNTAPTTDARGDAKADFKLVLDHATVAAGDFDLTPV